jgi:hypothetical protein
MGVKISPNRVISARKPNAGKFLILRLSRNAQRELRSHSNMTSGCAFMPIIGT